MWTRIVGSSVMVALICTLGCNKADFSAEQRGGQANVSPSPIPSGSPAPSINQNNQTNQNNTNINAGNNNEGLNGGDQNAQGYALTCKDPQPRRETLTGKPNSSVVIKGEMCPTSFGRLTVMFVVDFSGSMKDNDPSGFLNTSCGRLEAARAIIRKIETDMTAKDDIRIGMVAFRSTAALTENIEPLKDFKSNIGLFNSFCGYEQTASQASTNYRAAFDQTRFALNGLEGNKVVYFISDGLPTVGADGAPADNNDAGGKHKQAGLQALQSLQQSTPNLAVNAVFLNKGQTGQAEFDYLSALTGAASRVRVVSNANQLADKVVELSIPRAVLQEQLATAYVETVATGRKPVQLARFIKDPTRESVWLFETAPIVMESSPGVSTSNTIVVSAPDRSNLPYNSTMVVNFKPN